MSWSSQLVSMVFIWKLSVCSRVMRYSTVVLKSPRIDSSFRASTIFLGQGQGGGQRGGAGGRGRGRGAGGRGEV